MNILRGGMADHQDTEKSQASGKAPDAMQQQKRRNLAIALSLAAFCVIVFIVTVVKLSANAPQG